MPMPVVRPICRRFRQAIAGRNRVATAGASMVAGPGFGVFQGQAHRLHAQLSPSQMRLSGSEKTLNEGKPPCSSIPSSPLPNLLRSTQRRLYHRLLTSFGAGDSSTYHTRRPYHRQEDRAFADRLRSDCGGGYCGREWSLPYRKHEGSPRRIRLFYLLAVGQAVIPSL